MLDVNINEIRKGNKIIYIEDDPCTLSENFDKNIILDKNKDEKKFEQILKNVGLLDQYSELSKKTPDQLSAGQKQRVAIARALYHIKRNSVLVMDEPFSALDNNVIKVLTYALEKYKSFYNLTIFEITHDLKNMSRYDYIYFFEEGNIIYEGSHEELLKNDKYLSYLSNSSKV